MAKQRRIARTKRGLGPRTAAQKARSAERRRRKKERRNKRKLLGGQIVSALAPAVGASAEQATAIYSALGGSVDPGTAPEPSPVYEPPPAPVDFGAMPEAPAAGDGGGLLETWNKLPTMGKVAVAGVGFFVAKKLF